MPVNPSIVTRRKPRTNSLQPTLVDFCEHAASAANQQQKFSVRLQSPKPIYHLPLLGHLFPAAFGLEDTGQIGKSYGSPIARTLRLHRQLLPAHSPRGAEETTTTPFLRTAAPAVFAVLAGNYQLSRPASPRKCWSSSGKAAARTPRRRRCRGRGPPQIRKKPGGRCASACDGLIFAALF
jgi:hypothetical protein